MSDLMLQTVRFRLTALFSKEAVSPPITTLRPWNTYLPAMALCGQEVVSLLGRPQTTNALTLRYIVMDLLDLLAELGTIPQSPLFAYGEIHRSFDVQFQYAWHDLTRSLFTKQSKAARRVYLWAKSVYDHQQFVLSEDNLFEGMSLWDTQPAIMVGPSPISWDMAVPRLLAYSFTDKIWEIAHRPVMRYAMYGLLEEFTTIPLPPAPCCSVLLKRIKNLGLKHLESLLYPDDLSPHPEIAAARYAWMQTCLYYALIRGKLDRLGVSDQPLSVQQAVQALDAALVQHIKHLTTKDSS